ncbi:pimeloyl-CoA dehydrogenase large subunit [Methylobacterium sp. PvP062]|jgi:pimeloyl-CoA dehydrogenase large subunit|uniref:Pimeloyl-CoA dehydrogenase large subunit n=1 Tax=Methylobacterium radiotolerans TaxID=31998 RepID=A0ABV2NI48_9HYPH|nr:MULTISPECIES: acyl-CoA dehydrogenase family protein [Methylobacterium]MCX7336122.1 acyl-CoA dehydrogenase family protein [Hyphomicrobiales bacterium]KIU30509.1 acyl-CoA dehydrogenase [Methylobacterium radiotolerans]KZC03145.1 putative acyl-CoA dehydrogenase fadE25 [Methylobacterium radiotolerans]MBN6823591.1 acyl-CoA dehydrogenase family protein [Methylobacterium organophilum]MBP2497085.1 pimeloyl-CoA dehydrogenase large subunit [Methylobacterium sp. PvP105]
MDLRFTQEEADFRQEVRTFFRTEIPAEIRRKISEGRSLAREDYVTSQRILNAKGWAVPHWPKEWGGQDWDPIRRYIFMEELMQAAVPLPLQFNCFMVGPVIAAFGNEEQKKRFLPRIANLDDWWCQGFSEPGAGSDLASLKTKAVRDGDHYIVDGQKTWTTLGQYADWIFCLVRTDPAAKKQAGISFLLIDMKTPGISVRPIITIDGRHEVNEVFFDSVRVPVENLVGEENKGWDYAKFLLANERTGIARIGLTKERVARVKRLAKETPAGAGTMWDEPDFRSRVASLEVELKALEITQMRVVSAQGRRDASKPDPASSILKIKGSELQQMATELLVELAGPLSLPAPVANDVDALGWEAFAAPTYLNTRKVSIYGGSNEIQRNVIAKAILGL